MCDLCVTEDHILNELRKHPTKRTDNNPAVDAGEPVGNTVEQISTEPAEASGDGAEQDDSDDNEGIDNIDITNVSALTVIERLGYDVENICNQTAKSLSNLPQSFVDMSKGHSIKHIGEAASGAAIEVLKIEILTHLADLYVHFTHLLSEDGLERSVSPNPNAGI